MTLTHLRCAALELPISEGDTFPGLSPDDTAMALQYLAEHGRPETVADMEAHAALGYRGPRGVAPWLAVRPTGDVVTVPRNVVLITNHGLLMLRAALAGEGLAFLPLWGVSEAIAEGTLEEVTLQDARLVVSTGAEMSLFLLYHPKKARLGKVRAMVDFLMDALGEP